MQARYGELIDLHKSLRWVQTLLSLLHLPSTSHTWAKRIEKELYTVSIPSYHTCIVESDSLWLLCILL